MLQKEISWETGFSRVKTHRVLARLIRRGVVIAEKYYNTNKITLADFLLEKNERRPMRIHFPQKTHFPLEMIMKDFV
jgi:DNA-binding transcriptional regulator LsrR (DeoR family)